MLLLPLLLAICGSLLLFSILIFVTKHSTKASLIASAFVMCFFLYGPLFDVLVFVDLPASKEIVLCIISIVALVFTGSFIWAKNALFLSVTSILLRLFCVILISINLAIILWFHFFTGDTEKAKHANRTIQLYSNEKPDIYYIIPDEYASSSTLKTIYGEDNFEFEQYLSSRGFRILNNMSIAYDIYPETRLSLATTLNFETPSSASDAWNFKLINNNIAFTFLRQAGYKTIVFDNFVYDFPAKLDFNADITIRDKHARVASFETDRFYRTLLEDSILAPFFQIKYPNKTSGILNTFARLENIPKEPGPKFVLIHIPIPHAPFIFDRNGRFIKTENALNFRDKHFYIEQYFYVNNMIKKVVDGILKSSAKPPVILIQSDHGPRNHKDPRKPLVDISVPIKETRKLFAAYYLPDMSDEDLKGLPDDLAQSQSLKIIFSRYIGHIN